MGWIPLHVHSQYSILDALAPVEKIANRASTLGMKAVALTDHGNLFGAVEFVKACKEVDVKPIIGCEFYVAPESRTEKRRSSATNRTSFNLILLAKDNEGYHNLCQLSSKAYLEGFYYHPRIDVELLERHRRGLICLSGCLNSKVAYEILHNTKESALEVVRWHHELFGADYYLELMRHPMSPADIDADGLNEESWLLQQYESYISRQERVNAALIQFSRSEDIAVVATNDSHYLDRGDWRAHEILLNIQSGEPVEMLEKDSFGKAKARRPNPKRTTYPSHEYYFKSPLQMEQLFSDIPEALSNTLEIAEKCTVELDFKTKHYPVYIPPDLSEKDPYSKEEQAAAVKRFLWKLCEEGIPRRYTASRLAKIGELYPSRDPMDVVRERLEYEMSVIVPKGMGDYLLIVWDFIHWAKNNNIPVGPGRGSGAGSIVLYLIGITDIEPLRFHLFFERFINPERLSYPDIDVDISMDGRSEVIRYTLEKYGKDNVAQIITFGTMKAKMTIKDVGRVLNVPLSKVNALAKLVPEDLNITLEKALERDMDLLAMYESDSDAQRIIDIGRRLEGSIRNSGIHAAGIIIGGQPLSQLIPICLAKESEIPVTQYSMKPVEQLGMLKVDFLGLKTLTAIKFAVEALHRRGIEIEWIDLPLDDKATFELLNQGKTLGIFQLESSGMQDLARNLHLDKFEEIIAVGALYRPGPMDMIPSFINRKHGREQIEYDHPWMKEILSETYGIMVYQEQVMQIASTLAKYSLGEGDVLRRAMGKKDHKQMKQQREKFRQGALTNNIDEETSMRIFDKMEKFAAYGFNKSHATAYGYLSYVTAYLKANFPKEWMAALMTCDSSDLSKVAKFIRESHTMGIAILPPDVNEAGNSFTATPKGIRFAMSGIKGIGTAVVEAIVDERNRNGPFASFYDFVKRTDSKRVSKKATENLVDAGSFDFTGWPRDALRESIDPIFDLVTKENAEAAKGVMSLFAALEESSENRFSKPPAVKKKSTKQELLFKERTLLGFFLTSHPLDDLKELLRRLSCVPFSEINTLPHDSVCRIAFLVEGVQVRISSKSQKKFAIVTIGDGIESLELPVWPEMYDQKSQLLVENRLLVGVVQIDRKEGSLRLSCKWLDDLTEVNEKMVEECDRAYEKAKLQSERFSSIKSKQGQSSRPKGVGKLSAEKEGGTHGGESAAPYSIKVDIEKLRLSDLMQIKQLFNSFRGKRAVEIDFCREEIAVAALKIGSSWGVSGNGDLALRLKEIGAVIAVSDH